MEKLSLISLLKYWIDKHYEYKEKPCEHEFEQIDSTVIYEYDESKRPCSRNLTYMCAKCGEVKKVVIGKSLKGQC